MQVVGASAMRGAMRWAMRGLAFVAVLLGAVSTAFPALARSRVGVVLMHGKQSTPERMQKLADALSGAGYLVERPEMCWSERRIYDRPYLDCLADADAAVARLRIAGVSAVVVAGQSLGGHAASPMAHGVTDCSALSRPLLLDRRRGQRVQ